MTKKAVVSVSLSLVFLLTAAIASVFSPVSAEAVQTIGYCSENGYVNPYSLQSMQIRRVKGNPSPSSRVARTAVEYEEVVLYYFALEQWNESVWGWRNVAWAVEVHADHLHAITEAMRMGSRVTVSGKCGMDGDTIIVFNPTRLTP